MTRVAEGVRARPYSLRALLRRVGRGLLRVLTHTTIHGARALSTPGPVIFAANHVSTFDAMLIFLLLPEDTVFVGPGDFPLEQPGEWLVNHLGLIRMKRGSVDRDGLKQMAAALKRGGRLALFPEGGTWEKPIDDVKSGVAYLSQTTGAQIVPIGLGGTYRAWDVLRALRRPAISVRIGAPLPPVRLSGDRWRRQDELQAAAVDLMARIYELLPPETQAHYDRYARVHYAGRLVFDPPRPDNPAISFDALAELISKPNLFRPLHRVARLPVAPFLQPGRFYPLGTMRLAAESLLSAFAEGDFAGYLEYRLGEDKADRVRAALRAIIARIDAPGPSGARAAFAVRLDDAPH